jgi:hypothetical protein
LPRNHFGKRSKAAASWPRNPKAVQCQSALHPTLADASHSDGYSTPSRASTLSIRRSEATRRLSKVEIVSLIILFFSMSPCILLSPICVKLASAELFPNIREITPLLKPLP